MVLPVSELEFLRDVPNHRELSRKLVSLGMEPASSEIRRQAIEVGTRWFLLGQDHLKDAKQALKASLRRATYSRAYYAAYSASKAVRYIASGSVSMKGDDHTKAPDLPGDFPDAQKWSAKITALFELRLRADYDNWRQPKSAFSLSPDAAVNDASGFVSACKRYLSDAHKIKL